MNTFDEKLYCDKCKKHYNIEINSENNYENESDSFSGYNITLHYTRCPVCFNAIPLKEKTYFVKFNFSDYYEEINSHSKYKAGIEYAEIYHQMFDNVKHLIIFKEGEKNSN